MSLQMLQLEIVDHVAVLTMDSPPLNALDMPLLRDFEAVLDEVEGRDDVRAMLLRSACPGFFSAGDDVTKLVDAGPELVGHLRRAHTLLGRFEALEVPTVAAINGHALGGGLELALVCDFRFMGSGSGTIGCPEVRLGMLPVLGGTQRLTRAVGPPRALEMMVKGLQLSPERARELDLVHDVFPAGELEERCLDRARRLALQATRAIGWIKRCLRTGLDEGLAAGNAVIQKPSEFNPLIGELIRELFEEAGFPAGLVQMVRRLVAGSVMVNNAVQSGGCATLPFGGEGDSGLGRVQGEAAFFNYTAPKSFMRSPKSTAELWMPYHDGAEAMIRGLGRTFYSRSWTERISGGLDFLKHRGGQRMG